MHENELKPPMQVTIIAVQSTRIFFWILF